jgi:quercetin dioxygenase-like cupin family protein
MIHFQHYSCGDLFGIAYTFDKAGEGLRMHSHEREAEHNVIVLRGSILIYGDIEPETIEAGHIFTFESHKKHEIAALQPDTAIINMFLYGKPAHYEDLPANVQQGELEIPLTHYIADFANPVAQLRH